MLLIHSQLPTAKEILKSCRFVLLLTVPDFQCAQVQWKNRTEKSSLTNVFVIHEQRWLALSV